MATLDPDDAELLESYNIVLWSIDTLDWSHRSPEEISDYVTNEIKSGDIVLMHDYIGFNSPTPEAVPTEETPSEEVTAEAETTDSQSPQP